MTRNKGQYVIDPSYSALFIEYLHTASLVMDDLPYFDDDDYRRGKLAVHKKTNSAIAQMVSLSLMSASFQSVTRQIDWIRSNCPEFKNVDRLGVKLCHDIGEALGVFGAAGGQYMDSSLSPNELYSQYGNDAVLVIIQQKTGAFFELSFLTGWLISGGSIEDGVEVQKAGLHFGIAFQIADDIGDMIQDKQRRDSGKPGWNYANEHGIEEAIRVVKHNLNSCQIILEEKKLYSPLWIEIYQKVWKMADLEMDP